MARSSLAALGIALLGVGCGGRTLSGQGGGQPDPASPVVSEPSVFAALDIRIAAEGYDAPDLNVRDPVTGAFPAEPPISVGLSATVEINGGTAEGRVPGLSVLADGAVIQETGSAASPPKFSFQYLPPNPVHGQGVAIELRLETTSFSLSAEPPVVEIVSPSVDETMAADQTLVLRWTGTSTAPDQASITPRGSCAVLFQRSGDDPRRGGSGTSRRRAPGRRRNGTS